MAITQTLQQSARTQFAQAVQEHWCIGENEFFGFMFYLLPSVIEAMEAGDPEHADLIAASQEAEKLATAAGYY